MGIFDRLRSACQVAGGNRNKAGAEQDALRLIDEGCAHEANGRADEAMQCYLEATRRAPKQARAHFSLGNILLAKEDLERAVDAFKTAIKLEPGYAEAHCGLGLALKESGQLDDAVASYSKALALNPDLPQAQDNLRLITAGWRRWLPISPTQSFIRKSEWTG